METATPTYGRGAAVGLQGVLTGPVFRPLYGSCTFLSTVPTVRGPPPPLLVSTVRPLLDPGPRVVPIVPRLPLPAISDSRDS